MVATWPPCVVQMPVSIRVLDGGDEGACRGTLVLATSFGEHFYLKHLWSFGGNHFKSVWCCFLIRPEDIESPCYGEESSCWMPKFLSLESLLCPSSWATWPECGKDRPEIGRFMGLSYSFLDIPGPKVTLHSAQGWGVQAGLRPGYPPQKGRDT